MSDFECPYCEEEYDYCDDPLSEGDVTEFQCSSCEKMFTLSVSYSTNYRTETSECLNDGKHEWEDAVRAPWIISKKIKQRCVRGCAREQSRDASPDELKKEIEQIGDSPFLRRIALGG